MVSDAMENDAEEMDSLEQSQEEGGSTVHIK